MGEKEGRFMILYTVVAELILMIIVWNRGWRWLAFLPIIIDIFLMVLIDYLIKTYGGSAMISGVGPYSAIFDIAAILALIVMCIKKPREKLELRFRIDSSGGETES